MLNRMVWTVGIGQPLQIGNLGEIVLHQGDVCGFHLNVAAHAAHGDTGVGSFESRCIVDAVADHSDGSAGCLQLGDVSDLFLRQ